MATTTRAPRPPQDHKPKQSEILAAEAADEKPEGAELLRLADLPVWDQTDILAQLTETFTSMGVDLENIEKIELTVNGPTMRALGAMVKNLLPYTTDPEKFTDLVSGSGALQRGMDVAMWYFGALGEFEGSAN